MFFHREPRNTLSYSSTSSHSPCTTCPRRNPRQLHTPDTATLRTSSPSQIAPLLGRRPDAGGTRRRTPPGRGLFSAGLPERLPHRHRHTPAPGRICLAPPHHTPA